jgi:hypothetical protein
MSALEMMDWPAIPLLNKRCTANSQRPPCPTFPLLLMGDGYSEKNNAISLIRFTVSE